jgi:hypothetical protein
LALDELEHPAGVSGARKVFRIGLRMKNASIINGSETHQFKGVKGHRDRPWIKHSVGVEFQAFEPDRDREIEPSSRLQNVRVFNACRLALVP